MLSASAAKSRRAVPVIVHLGHAATVADLLAAAAVNIKW